MLPVQTFLDQKKRQKSWNFANFAPILWLFYLFTCDIPQAIVYLPLSRFCELFSHEYKNFLIY